MAAVLGVSAHYHDAAAALVIDGRLIAAMQEERFSRVKGDASLPLRAIAACLRAGGIEAGALDCVAFYENPYARLERVTLHALRTFPRSFASFPRAMAAQLGGKVWVLDALCNELGIARSKVCFRDHHASHAASAFFCSPFARAAVLTADGVGEETSTALFVGDGERLELRETIAFPHSLGLLYAAITAYLGFSVNEGESKVMGLAAYGAPALRDAFARVLRLSPDGRFELDGEYFADHTDAELGFGPKLESLLGPRRTPGKAWDLAGDAADRRYADVAATLQAVTEEALIGLGERARSIAGCRELCVAGGLGLNAVANARLGQGGPLFVQPAAGDAGGALGAAILTAIALGDPRPTALHSAALGEPADAATALALAHALGLSARRCGDPLRVAAEHLARGEVLGFVQGRFEWGPRALGQRSLLALPAPSDVRERINRAIKRREPFRPFAPAILDQHASEFFGEHAALPARFMTTIASVLPEQRQALAAVTHVDGSARLQRVAAETPFGALIARVAAERGAPVLLNTSLNGKGEPIAASAADCLHFLLGHRIDAMLIEDVLIEPRAQS